jgi:hypothetical protein
MNRIGWQAFASDGRATGSVQADGSVLPAVPDRPAADGSRPA